MKYALLLATLLPYSCKTSIDTESYNEITPLSVTPVKTPMPFEKRLELFADATHRVTRYYKQMETDVDTLDVFFIARLFEPSTEYKGDIGREVGNHYYLFSDFVFGDTIPHEKKVGFCFRKNLEIDGRCDAFLTLRFPPRDKPLHRNSYDKGAIYAHSTYYPCKAVCDSVRGVINIMINTTYSKKHFKILDLDGIIKEDARLLYAYIFIPDKKYFIMNFTWINTDGNTNSKQKKEYHYDRDNSVFSDLKNYI